jgi:hypothetical protein
LYSPVRTTKFRRLNALREGGISMGVRILPIGINPRAEDFRISQGHGSFVGDLKRARASAR